MALTKRIRFHLDEHIDPDIATALRHYGVEVTTTVEAGLRTADDAKQLAFIRREHRVMVTSDKDFLRFASLDNDHPGIAFLGSMGRSISEIIEGLILIYEALAPEEMAGQVEYL